MVNLFNLLNYKDWKNVCTNEINLIQFTILALNMVTHYKWSRETDKVNLIMFTDSFEVKKKSWKSKNR